MEKKAFAVGLRIQHPQAMIKSIPVWYGSHSDILGPAAYKVTHQTSLREAYSFCMCPGGYIGHASLGETAGSQWYE